MAAREVETLNSLVALILVCRALFRLARALAPEAVLCRYLPVPPPQCQVEMLSSLAVHRDLKLVEFLFQLDRVLETTAVLSTSALAHLTRWVARSS